MAAGLGFKTFTTGEVLTAADVNGYLMQGVLVFASAAARNAAITSPQEGQFAFTKDTNGLWYYDGAAWVASGATGDIEGVTAGVGISGGGTSGTVTITNDMATTITAAGDIVVGTGSGTYDNLPIGTTGQLLTADTSVSPYKVKWATPATSASGLTKVTSASFSGVANTGTTFDGVFTSTYTNYQIIFVGRSSGAANLHFQFRVGATTQNAASYDYGSTINSSQVGADVRSSPSGATQYVPTSLENVVQQTIMTMYVTGVSTGTNPAYHSFTGAYGNALRGMQYGGGIYNSGISATGFIFSTSTGNMTGTVYVYGLAN